MIARSPQPRWNRGTDGFTLIEVLVSLVLLGLVLALLSGAMRFARGTWDAAARLDREAGYDMAGGFLRARLGEAMPLFEKAKGGVVRVAFQGGKEALRFVAPTPNGPAGAGLYWFVLEPGPGAGQTGARTLLVKLAPFQAKPSESTIDTPFDDHVLVENVKSVAFRYFGRGTPRATPTWHEAWTRTDSLPDLVELTIIRNDREGPLSLVIELRLRNRI